MVMRSGLASISMIVTFFSVLCLALLTASATFSKAVVVVLALANLNAIQQDYYLRCVYCTDRAY